jgi:hypothetical protein
VRILRRNAGRESLTANFDGSYRYLFLRFPR